MDTKFPWWPIDYLFRVRYSGKLSMIKGKMEEEGGEKREGRWKLSVKSGIASDRMVDGAGTPVPSHNLRPPDCNFFRFPSLHSSYIPFFPKFWNLGVCAKCLTQIQHEASSDTQSSTPQLNESTSS